MLAVSMSPPVAHYPVVQKRPKLSLKTSELPINYGTSSRALSTIATPTAAVTPTTLNTFNNTYDLTHRPSPTSATASPLIIRVPSVRDRVSRSQSPRPKRTEVAYTVNLPYGVRPILKNSPFPRVRNNSISASPRSTTRRVFFPAPKKVTFRNTIEEEIVTNVYTARHSDLFQSGSVELQPKNDTSASKPQQTTVSSVQSEHGSSISISSTQQRTPHHKPQQLVTSLKLSTIPTEDASSISVATPAITRKQRKWEWTLAPIANKPEAESDHERDSQTKSSPDTSLSGSSPSSASSSSSSSSTSLSPSTRPVIKLNTNVAKVRSFPASAVEPSSNPQSDMSASAQPQPTIAAQPHWAATTTPKLLPTIPNTSSTTLPSAPHQRRTTSLDGSSPPRKRKAECLLDMSSVASSLAANSGSAGAADGMERGHGYGGDAGQSSVKRRERAATL